MTCDKGFIRLQINFTSAMVLTDRKSNTEAGIFREHCRQPFKQMVADTTTRQQTISCSEFRTQLSASECIVTIRMMEFYLQLGNMDLAIHLVFTLDISLRGRISLI
jgi:hypothetical protein